MAKSWGYATAGFGYVLVLMVLAFLFTGGGHGTGLFGMVILSPGSVLGDNPLALTGVVFWPVIGFLLGRPPSRGVKISIAVLMLAHYAVAALHFTQEGRDGGAGFLLVWDRLPVLAAIFCLLYIAGNVTVWMLALRKQAVQN